jgi:hypothetical protein
MKKFVCLGMVGVVLACLSLGAVAQVTKGKTRPLTTKQLMGGLVKPNCGGIGDGLKEAPKDDAGWAALATKAALLNEASFILMDDDRCPDATWAGAAKTLRAGSAAVLTKIEAKDAAGAKTEFDTMTKACAECHKAHKK